MHQAGALNHTTLENLFPCAKRGAACGVQMWPGTDSKGGGGGGEVRTVSVRNGTLTDMWRAKADRVLKHSALGVAEMWWVWHQAWDSSVLLPQTEFLSLQSKDWSNVAPWR